MNDTVAADGLAVALRTAGLHLVGPLGAGAGGPRWGARDESGTRWVVTVLAVRSTVHRAHLTERVARLAEVEHEHLATVGPVLTLPGARMAVLHQEVAGTDLATVRAGRGPWEPGEVVTVLVPVAGALAALHDAGLCHGDVAPANVILTPDGRAVLVDLVGSDDAREAGTPGFAAPERAQRAEPPGDVHAVARLGLHLLGPDQHGPYTRGKDARGPDPRGTDPRGTGGVGATRGADDEVETSASADPVAARDRLAAVLRAASQEQVDRRPTAIELAAQVYALCAPVPVGQPDPAVLARLTLRRLGDLAAADRTRLVTTGSTDTRRGRHRRRRRRRGLVLGCVIAVLLACAGTVVATATGPADGAAGLAARSTAGPPGRSGEVDHAASVSLAAAIPAAIRLTYARAQALAARDRARLVQVTVPGSPAARADRVSLDALYRSESRPSSSAPVRIRVDQVRLLGRTADARVPDGCAPCARVLVVAEARAGTGPRAGTAPPDTAAGRTPDAEAGQAADGVVLVMRATDTGWRVSAVEPDER